MGVNTASKILLREAMKRAQFLYITVFLLFCNTKPELESDPDKEQDSLTYNIEIIEGVKHIHNFSPKWGDEPKVVFEFVQKIGDLESDDENYMLFRPTDICLDTNGNFFILDAGNYTIKIFDRNYKYISSIGNKGQGPGELTGPSRMDMLPDGSIIINDRASRTVNIFSHDGDFIQRFRNEGMSPDQILALNSGDIAVFYHLKHVAGGTGFTSALVNIFDGEGNKIREFVQPRLYEDPGTNFWCNSIALAGDDSDNIYVNFEAQNRIEKYSSSGDIIFRADRALDYEESPEILREPVPGSQGTLVALSYNIFSKGIQVDGKGRIWSATLKRQKTFEEKKEQDEAKKRNDIHGIHILEVFDNDGILLGRIKEEFFFGQHFRIFGDRLFLIDREDEMVIYEYRIVVK